MTSDHAEVRGVLASLAFKIRESNKQMNGQNIGNALYSLHGMDDSIDEVKDVLAALAHKIATSTYPMSGLDVGMALYGMNSKDASSPEVRVILGALIYKIRHTDIVLPLRELSMAIIGTLKAAPWIRDDFLKVLASKSPGMKLSESD